MAFWSSHFHKSDTEDAFAKRISGITDNVVQMQVVLGNENTENSVVHAVASLKRENERGRVWRRQLSSRMNSMTTVSEQLKEDVERVRKMKGPKGDRGLQGERGLRGPQGERGLRGGTGTVGSVLSSPLHCSECILLRLRSPEQIPVDRKDE